MIVARQRFTIVVAGVSKLQQPTVMRQQATARAEAPDAAPKPRAEKRRAADADDYLDIPAFLRRQAD